MGKSMSIAAMSQVMASFKKNRMLAALIVVGVALGSAIVASAISSLMRNVQQLSVHTGIMDSQLLVLRTAIGASKSDIANTRSVVNVIREVPGVSSAAAINTMPLSHFKWGLRYSTQPSRSLLDGVSTAVYFGGPSLFKSLGIHILHGSNFPASAYRPLKSADVVQQLLGAKEAIITQALATTLWGEANPLGKVMYAGVNPVVVRGVVANVVQPYLLAGSARRQDYYSVFLPLRATAATGAWYVVRCNSSSRAQVLKSVESAVYSKIPNVVFNLGEDFTTFRAGYLSTNRSTALTLAIIIVALVLVAIVGVVGLMSYWIEQRRRQVGIRRALGARRVDILAYFLVENFLLTSGGVFLGILITIIARCVAMAEVSLHRLQLSPSLYAAIIFYLIGQCAVFIPALRAARLQPVSAIRSA